MTSVNMKTHLPVPAEEVWRTIGGFNALPDWHPGVSKSELEDGGTLRTLTLPTGATIVERLEHADENARTYTYSIVDSPLPVSDYRATIRVVEDEDGRGCTVEWSSEFEPAGVPGQEAMAAIKAVFEAGLQNLEKMFGRA